MRAFDPRRHVAARGGPEPAAYSPPAAMNWVSRAELRTYTHHQLLRDTDVMSMAHSLEVRVPLLDVRLVEAVLRLPVAARCNHNHRPKPLLSWAMAEQLPPLVHRRRDKQGFIFPFVTWLQNELQPQVQASLYAAQAQRWLQPEAVAAVQHEFQAGRLHWSRLWALVALAPFLV